MTCATGYKAFISFINRAPLPSPHLTSPSSSAPSLMLQGVPRRTGAPCDTEGRCWGGGGSGGVLKEFAGPHSSSLQIQAIPGRSHTVELIIWTLWILSLCNPVVVALEGSCCCGCGCFFILTEDDKVHLCDCSPWEQRAQCSGTGRARRMAQPQPPPGS